MFSLHPNSSLPARQTSNSGFAIFLTTLIVLGLVTVVVASLSLATLIEQKITRNFAQSAQAYFAAEAGVEDSLYRLIAGKNYQATNSLTVGSAEVAVNISDEGSDQKIIQAAGEESNRFRSLQVKLKTSTKTISFRYGVQVGEGGLVMYNNSRVSGNQVSGNVYSNGPILGNAGATITGDAWVANRPLAADQQSLIATTDFIFGQQVNQIDAAQAFTPSITDRLVKVHLYLKKVGSPGNKTVRILTDNDNQPSKTLAGGGAYGTLYTNQISAASYGWTEVMIAMPPTLQAGVKYWIVVDTSANNNHYFLWGRDQTDSYPGGTGKYSPNWNATSPIWQAVAGDLAFKAFLGEEPNFLNNVSVGNDAHAHSISYSIVGRDAYYQSLFYTTVLGQSYPDSPDPAPETMPISESNIADWKAEATAGGVINHDYILAMGGHGSLGPKKINGNLILFLGADLTLTGPVYVTGYIMIYQNCQVRLSADYANFSGVLLNDGFVSIANNVDFITTSPGAYILLLSTATGDVLNIVNNSTAAIFYAPNGNIFVANNVILKEATAQKITLANNAQVIYESGLASTKFSSGAGATWEISEFKEVP